MQIQHEEENRLRALKCEAEVEVLKQEIATAFAQFSGGAIGARELLASLHILPWPCKLLCHSC